MRLPILFVVQPSCQCPPARSPTLRRPGETPEVLVQCAAADQVDRAPGRGFAIGTTPGVAAECGAPLAGEADAVDCLEEALEVDLRPSGDTQAVSTTSGISSKSSSRSVAGAAIFGKRTRRLGRSALLTVQLAYGSGSGLSGRLAARPAPCSARPATNSSARTANAASSQSDTGPRARRVSSARHAGKPQQSWQRGHMAASTAIARRATPG